MASTLTPTDKRLCILYAAVAVTALVATQTSLVMHFVHHHTVWSFFSDTVANPAATLFTLDALLVAVSALVLMVVESRRIGVPRVWIYVALTFVVAISVALPLFLIARQRRLAELRPQD